MSSTHISAVPEISPLPFDSFLHSSETIAFDTDAAHEALSQLDSSCCVFRKAGQIGVLNTGSVQAQSSQSTSGTSPSELIAFAPALGAGGLGDPEFCRAHGVKMAYMTGAMANGIASEELVIALGKAKLLGSFGAAGLLPSRVESAIQRIQTALGVDGPYAFNLIHSPSEEALERGSVELFLKHKVRCVEASAFLGLTPHIVRYRVAGLELNANNEVVAKNRVIAKVSRTEVAARFMEPAPEKMLKQLLQQNLITPLQAELAGRVPVADDITVEADSGGHTDNRPLLAQFPSILALRDTIQKKQNYPKAIRVGAGGGVGTPVSALATLIMGAAYVVTGSVNQACIEAGASLHTRKVLAQAGMADVAMAPAADMFEMGVELQVLKRGTLFPMRAKKLYELYRQYDSIDAIPSEERSKIEAQIFREPLEQIWQKTESYFRERDPRQIERALQHPKRKMALIFRWYLGWSSRWANQGEAGREVDYQIWCGPSMGAFNDWTRNSYLEDIENRKVVDVAEHIMNGAAYLYRVQHLKQQGINFPAHFFEYIPFVIE